MSLDGLDGEDDGGHAAVGGFAAVLIGGRDGEVRTRPGPRVTAGMRELSKLVADDAGWHREEERIRSAAREVRLQRDRTFQSARLDTRAGPETVALLIDAPGSPSSPVIVSARPASSDELDWVGFLGVTGFII